MRVGVFKSAVSGRFVTRKFAQRHPEVTYRLTLRGWKHCRPR